MTTKIKNDTRRIDQDRLPIVFQALSDAGRLDMIKILLKSDDLCVSEIAEELGLTASAISQRFRILEMSGVVRKIRKGQRICYQVRKDDPIVSVLTKLFNH